MSQINEKDGKNTIITLQIASTLTVIAQRLWPVRRRQQNTRIRFESNEEMPILRQNIIITRKIAKCSRSVGMILSLLEPNYVND